MAATNYTPISLYYSTTASAVPVNTNLVNGELAINITDGKLFYKDNGGTVQVLATKGAGTIGGSNTQVQYNNSGSLAGSANLTFNGTTLTANTLNLTNALGTTYGGTGLTSFTANGVVYASSSSVLTTGSALVFDGTNLTAGSNTQNLGTAAARWGTVYASTFSDGTDQLVGSTSTTARFGFGASWAALAFAIGGSEQMRLTSTGLGIGTSSPSVKLEVAGNAKLTGTNLAIVPSTATSAAYLLNTNTGGNFFFGIDNSTGASFGAGAYGRVLYSGGAYPMAFFTNDLERMRLDASGNLGIGTTSPSTKLDISGTLRIDATSNIYGKSDNTSFVSLYGGGAYNSGAGIGLGGSSNSGNPNTIVFTRGSYVESARLDSSGNLGLGVTPSAWASGQRALQTPAGAIWNFNNVNMSIVQNVFNDGTSKYVTNGFASTYNQNSGQHVWNTAPSGTAGNAITFTQAMTLDNSGNLLVGTTAAAYASGERISVSPAASKNGIGISVGNTNNVGLGIYNGYTATGTATAVQFQDHNSVVRGSITVTTSGTLYNVTSDYRLKTVIGPITGHGERLDAIKPVDYTWNADGLRTRGFLAHEFQEVYPNSVTGTKDAVDEDGKPVYQNMQASTSEVIADLVAEIQSLRIRITQLEAK